MAKKSIGTLEYKVTVNMADFEKGMTATKKEMNAAARAVRNVQTPLEKYTKQLASLTNLKRKGLITQETYNKNLAKFKSELKDSTSQVNKATAAWQKYGKGVTAVGAAVGAVSFAVSGMVASIREQSDQIRRFELFGLSAAKSLGTYRFVAQQTGVELERLVDFQKELRIRIEEAARDRQGEQFENFMQIGMDPQYAKNIDDADKQLRRFLKGWRELNSESEKMTMLDQIGGDAGTESIEALRMLADGFDEAAAAAERLGFNIEQDEIDSLKKTNREIKAMTDNFNRLYAAIAREFSPQIRQSAKIAEGLTAQQSGSTSILRRALDVMTMGGTRTATGFLGAASGEQDIIVEANWWRQQWNRMWDDFGKGYRESQWEDPLQFVEPGGASATPNPFRMLNKPSVQKTFADAGKVMAEGFRDFLGMDLFDRRQGEGGNNVMRQGIELAKWSQALGFAIDRMKPLLRTEVSGPGFNLPFWQRQQAQTQFTQQGQQSFQSIRSDSDAAFRLRFGKMAGKEEENTKANKDTAKSTQTISNIASQMLQAMTQKQEPVLK